MSGSERTVLVTGASNGIGLEAALCFLEKGWNVVATMRHPEGRHTPLHSYGRHGRDADLVHLDVMDAASIRSALAFAVDKHGKIDVLVNNAGYAISGPFEATTREQMEREFDTNVFGLMDVTREILPVFRRQGGGVLVNLASMGGRLGFPLCSLYNRSKWAVEGFSEALPEEHRGRDRQLRLRAPRRRRDHLPCGHRRGLAVALPGGIGRPPGSGAAPGAS